ncbi:MAG: hypothetical protein QOD03_840 [Verrucomicrobiota bacterium]|jgi:hypothetical protein
MPAQPKYERASLDEVKKLARQVYGKTLDELFSMFGKPAREFGAEQKQHIYSDGRSHTFDFRRSFEFDGVGETVYTLRVDEEISGKLHFTMRGREILQHDNAA